MKNLILFSIIYLVSCQSKIKKKEYKLSDYGLLANTGQNVQPRLEYLIDSLRRLDTTKSIIFKLDKGVYEIKNAPLKF